jgi:hypothetical protein
MDCFDNLPFTVAVTSSQGADISKWNFYAAKRNGTSQVTLSVNGVAQTLTSDCSPDSDGNVQTVEIGRFHNYIFGDSYFAGSLDDVRVYNRALSVQEVQQLYAMSH